MGILDVPFTTARFEVVIDLDEPTAGLESPLCDAAFAECSGLEVTMQQKTIEVGGVNDRQIHLIGPITNGQVTLKRGMTDNLQLWTWFTTGTVPASVLTAHAQITMWDQAGNPTVEFDLTGCLPVKMRAPSFAARDGLVAVEELTLVYQQLTIAPPGGGGGLGFSAGTSVSAGLSAGASIGASASVGAGFGVGIG